MSEETKKKPGGNDNSGKKPYQRLKPYIIYDYLMRYLDEAHTIKVSSSRKETEEEDKSIQTYLETFALFFAIFPFSNPITLKHRNWLEGNAEGNKLLQS